MAASEQKWAAYSFNYPLVFYKSYRIAAITNYKPTKNFQKSKWFFDNAIIYYIRHILHNWLTQKWITDKKKKAIDTPLHKRGASYCYSVSTNYESWI